MIVAQPVRPGGKTQVAVLRTLAIADDDQGFVAATRTIQCACIKAADRKLLKRDTKQTNRWHITEYGLHKIRQYDDALAKRMGGI